MRYFKPYEFNCQCNCGLGYNYMHPDLIIALDRLRHIVNHPLILTSAIRCPDHNLLVGGSDTSSHLTGKAVDISCKDARLRFKILEACIFTGINRIGLGSGFIHIDTDKTKKSNLIWIC